jgi:hypothetical protein
MAPTDQETILYYRGYFIESRMCDGTATRSIKRPDGTWRDSPPTWVTGAWAVWVVFKPDDGGGYEEIGIVNSERAARHMIDELHAER